MALRKLENQIRGSSLAGDLEVEDCLSALWKYVLLGDENAAEGIPGTRPA